MSAGQDIVSAPVLGGEFAEHRPALLRHCYRMLGSFEEAEDVVQDVLLRAWRARDTYAGDAPLEHWLMRIATNACLNVLTRVRPRALPQLDHDPAAVGAPLAELEAATWVTPAPDARLYPDPAKATEAREEVALAFIALLQRLPPRQRAALLLKDVVGWPAEEIAAALELSVPSVNSALHRARETVAARPRGPVADPAPELLAAYLRSWETRDLDSLVALLRHDVVFAMPPHAAWFRGVEAVRAFLQVPPFSLRWARGLRATSTRANGLPAFVWYCPDDAGVERLHSIQVVRFEGGRAAEVTSFIGARYLHGFEVPAVLT
ncbi:MAG TPA: RNA polymerase subunit sigma-70 [Polyangia bacterium]|nr:RNA polymerase subunit sigma-70 [Polyangia bacterium]